MVRLTKGIEECFRGEQIGRLEPFRELSVDGRQHPPRLGGAGLPMVEPGEAHRAPEFPRESVLASRPVD